jgi:hypothetical protein
MLPQPLYSLRKRDRDQPIWTWITPERASYYAIPYALVELAPSDRDQVLVGPEAAREVCSFLTAEGFTDDEPGSARTPIDVVDMAEYPADLS